MMSFFKWLFSPQCDHEADMDNLEIYSCKNCKCKLSGIRYSSGGIGKSDSYFRWQLKCDLANPNSSLSKMVSNIDWDERIRVVKARIEKDKSLNK